MKKWIEKNLILVWVISSAIFAFVVHCLFSIAAPNEWLVAKWNAGEILTFVSTVALGLLAVWQNKKFKEESDKSQERMEKLTTKANELSVVSKIIEHENEKLSALKTKKQSFSDACNTTGISVDLSDIANQPDNFKKLYVKLKMDSRINQIKLCTIELLTEFKTYPDSPEVIKLIDLISEYSKCSIELAKDVRSFSLIDDTCAKKLDVEKNFITSFSEFISDRENMLNKVIYGNLTLDQIKAMYLENE